MTKTWRDMTAAERIAARIAHNREIDERIAREPLAHGLAGIVARLHARKQRATYGAVAGLLGVPAVGLMSGRAMCHEYSWVVAATGPHAGWPTDYMQSQMDPECLRQCEFGGGDVIKDPEGLRAWLAG